ncbi:MAG: 2-oxoacid:acceptor oxidoreductase subunit alpha [Proteobacteria bacterium]|nr:2-oxoacid:acceptor oxidoreductase subunit alpha [Pseudomonadota bacterium]
MPAKDLKNPLMPGNYYLSGNEAIADGALAAGCRFYAGYPITPSSEIMERMAQRMEEVEGIFIQMEDEIASICAVLGASWAGAKAMTATSGPGFSLMQEGIGYGAFTETPCVVVDIQRAGPATGQATRVGSGDVMQAKWGSHGDYQTIALSPWSAQEMFDLTVEAFNLAERFRVPVILLSDEATGHLMENVRIPETVKLYGRKRKKGGPPFGDGGKDLVPPMPAFGEGAQLLVTGSTHDPWGFRKTNDPEVHAALVERINKKILQARRTIIQTEEYFLEDADLAVVAYGFTARSAIYAVKELRKEGNPVGFLRLKTLWPFPQEQIQRLSSRVKRIFVPEMNLGQIAGEILKYSDRDVISYPQTNGEIIHPRLILAEIRRMI